MKDDVLLDLSTVGGIGWQKSFGVYKNARNVSQCPCYPLPGVSHVQPQNLSTPTNLAALTVVSFSLAGVIRAIVS